MTRATPYRFGEFAALFISCEPPVVAGGSAVRLETGTGLRLRPGQPT
ncbi:hypothetical protein ABZ357_18410 [Streptomyces sp. NPDC005917]